MKAPLDPVDQAGAGPAGETAAGVPSEVGSTTDLSERWIAYLALVAALAAMPLPTVGSTPELAAILAVSAVALLAGQRWALPLVVLTDIALLGALWPRAFHDPPSLPAQLGVTLGLVGALPGIVAMKRAATPLADLVVGHVSTRARRASRIALVVCAAAWIAAPVV